MTLARDIYPDECDDKIKDDALDKDHSTLPVRRGATRNERTFILFTINEILMTNYFVKTAVYILWATACCPAIINLDYDYFLLV